eukprot:gene9751-18742_t
MGSVIIALLQEDRAETRDCSQPLVVSRGEASGA